MTKSQLLRLLQTQSPELYNRYLREESRIIKSKADMNSKYDRLQNLDDRYEMLLTDHLQQVERVGR